MSATIPATSLDAPPNGAAGAPTPDRTRISGGASPICLPRPLARAKARELFERYPKAAYMTEIEFWSERKDGQIEFVVRRLPSAD